MESSFFQFPGVASAVRGSMEESLVQILSPKKKIDILRDIKGAKANCRPFVIVFCGVNGVGKSTNLAKVIKHRFRYFSRYFLGKHIFT